MIHEWERTSQNYQYIFGGEESYGSLIGTHVRDKDAVIASALISEIALDAKLQGMTLVDCLHNIYKKYGVYREKLLSLVFPGKEGADTMNRFMARLRTAPPHAFAGVPVISIEDYQVSKRLDPNTGKESPITLPKSDVLLYWLNDGSKLMIRPSGTEPKIKLYCNVVKKEVASIETAIKECDAKADLLLEALKKELT
jgi:phosphoglucomutase/phosphomannomutase